MSNLSKSIKGLYDGKISDEEVISVRTDLFGFCDLLMEIYQEQQVQNQLKNVNDRQYDNNGSKN